MTNQLGLALALGTAVCLAACNRGEQPTAAPQPQVTTPASGVTMPTSINTAMVSLIDHAAHELWNVEKTAPKTDREWQEVEHHAQQLLAADALLRVGGNGPMDQAWVRASGWIEQTQRLTNATTGAVDAARTKNLKGLVTANGRIVDACEGCHKQFKPELPSEGVVHPH